MNNNNAMKTNDESVTSINMEDFITFDVVNSAPPSECEDTDDIIVLSKVPASIQNLEFSLEEALFSPAGISALSSPKFVEMILASQHFSSAVQEDTKMNETRKKSIIKDIKHNKCRSCNLISDNLNTISCGCYCNI